MTTRAQVRYDAVFIKKGDMIYISHLDLMTAFRRAIRRGGLPFVLTAGFTPRVKLSMPRALKLGLESERETMSFWLTEEMDPEEALRAINKELPEGIHIAEVVLGVNSKQ